MVLTTTTTILVVVVVVKRTKFFKEKRQETHSAFRASYKFSGAVSRNNNRFEEELESILLPLAAMIIPRLRPKPE